MTLHTQVFALPESALIDAGMAIVVSISTIAAHGKRGIQRIYTLPRAEDYFDAIRSAPHPAVDASTFGWMAHDAHFPLR